MITGARVDTGRSLVKASGPAGVWATQRMMEAMAAGRKFSAHELRPCLDAGPSELRHGTVLRSDDWVFFDNEIVEEAQIRLQGVADLMANPALVRRIPNGLAKTMLEYETVSDMEDASVSMDGVTRSENDRVEFELAGLPLPLIHKDFDIQLRTLQASRESGEPLDTVNIRAAGRKISEKAEQILFQGYTVGKFGGRSIYGYTTHPNRNTASFGTNGSWDQSAKTGENILADVGTMKAALEGDRFYGPYRIYVASGMSYKLDEDFKAASDKSIRARLLEDPSIQGITVVDQLPADNVVMVQMTPDVVRLVEGEPLQTVQWDHNGGFQINFKAFAIWIPLIRADADGRSGIFHMS